MKETLGNAIQALKDHHLILIYISLFSTNALATSVVASLLNVEWSELSPSSKFCIYWVVLQNWTGTMLAFFNKAWAKNGTPQPPDPGEPR